MAPKRKSSGKKSAPRKKSVTKRPARKSSSSTRKSSGKRPQKRSNSTKKRASGGKRKSSTGRKSGGKRKSTGKRASSTARKSGGKKASTKTELPKITSLDQFKALPDDIKKKYTVGAMQELCAEFNIEGCTGKKDDILSLLSGKPMMAKTVKVHTDEELQKMLVPALQSLAKKLGVYNSKETKTKLSLVTAIKNQEAALAAKAAGMTEFKNMCYPDGVRKCTDPNPFCDTNTGDCGNEEWAKGKGFEYDAESGLVGSRAYIDTYKNNKWLVGPAAAAAVAAKAAQCYEEGGSDCPTGKFCVQGQGCLDNNNGQEAVLKLKDGRKIYGKRDALVNLQTALKDGEIMSLQADVLPAQGGSAQGGSPKSPGGSKPTMENAVAQPANIANIQDQIADTFAKCLQGL